MFDNCNPLTNGEEKFYLNIKDNIKIIFDVGCRSDSLFTTFKGDVHYFEPVYKSIDILKKEKNSNNNSYFNYFGLGEENKYIYYYPKYQSFYDRINSCSISDDSNKILLNIKKGKDYVTDNNIKHIDFLKIDTEGYELNVLYGFEDFIENINIIKLEYVGKYLDNNTKLIDIINYLKQKNFINFSYLTQEKLIPIQNYEDHYRYCNIVCMNKNINPINFFS